MFGLKGINGSSNLSAPYVHVVDVGYRAGHESNRNNFPNHLVEPTDPRFPAALQLPCADDAAGSTYRQCSRGIGNLATSSIEPIMIEVTLRPSWLPVRQRRRCLNISLYFVDWDGTNVPITGSGDVVHRKTAVDVFTVAPGLEIDVGHATAVVGHPAAACGRRVSDMACVRRRAQAKRHWLCRGPLSNLHCDRVQRHRIRRLLRLIPSEERLIKAATIIDYLESTLYFGGKAIANYT